MRLYCSTMVGHREASTNEQPALQLPHHHSRHNTYCLCPLSLSFLQSTPPTKSCSSVISPLLTGRHHTTCLCGIISDNGHQSSSPSLITSKVMATNQVSSSSRRSEGPDDQDQSRLEAVQKYEGDGAGAVINEFYSEQDYSKRRLGFLSRHPDYSGDFKLMPKVRRDADEVFHSQPAVLSVQKIRRRELDLDIDPLLPLPTPSNTQTIDDYSTYPAAEWVGGVPTDPTEILQQTCSYTIPTPPPATMAPPEISGVINDVGKSGASDHHRPAVTSPSVAARVDSVRNSPKLPTDPLSATISDKLIQSDSSTQSNLSDSNLSGGDIYHTQQIANTPPNRATSTTSQDAAASGTASHTMADTAIPNPPTEAQLRTVLDLLARPLPRDNGIGAVVGRAVNVPIKTQGTKRSTPSDNDETGESAPETAAPSPSKKLKLNSPKPSAAAEPAPAIRGEDREDAIVSDSEMAVSASPLSSRHQKLATTTSITTSDGIPVSSNVEDVATGLALPTNSKTATAAQKLRRQHLTDQRKSKRSGLRAADLKPEFWLKENITKPIEITQGPVRCVCGTWEDDGTADDDYAGCEKTSCQSWQHVACVGDAWKGSSKRYRCHQCDPYAHRVVLQKLRTGEEINGPE
ncbi:hypothetical protein DOTSEDRAFT_70440 [Dothistroma septosporum NZE10]|uniref:Zinc finger PHD-type domain-containing protein n=1 Tax=Dothistroma septosporum (strain NZE10 / CBS 128990) TaxID=675120 RepID=N1PSL3_DOTSN|nr:hypothetical protein DOTSEDRAFT_70440 [Dothistroma septosporum NZE10]